MQTKPTRWQCCVPWCPSNASDVPLEERNTYYSLHLFPKEELRCQVWIEQLELDLDDEEQWKPPARVCGRHFAADQKCGNKLRRDAVPLPRMVFVESPKKPKPLDTFSTELQITLHDQEGFNEIAQFMKHDEEVARFDWSSYTEHKDQGNQWLINIMIDPRITENLPRASVGLELFEVWRRFTAGIFYVGKGTTLEHYSDLREALEMPSSVKSKKISRIKEIWGSGSGVICLQEFYNLTMQEALTREAAIIDALDLSNSSNHLHIPRGSYFGPPLVWAQCDKNRLGIVLLYKAMLMFLAEGETQLFQKDLK